MGYGPRDRFDDKTNFVLYYRSIGEKGPNIFQGLQQLLTFIGLMNCHWLRASSDLSLDVTIFSFKQKLMMSLLLRDIGIFGSIELLVSQAAVLKRNLGLFSFSSINNK